jgi:hypothetical protein
VLGAQVEELQAKSDITSVGQTRRRDARVTNTLHGELLVLDRLHTTAPESMAAATSATVGERARRALGGSKGATPGSSSR